MKLHCWLWSRGVDRPTLGRPQCVGGFKVNRYVMFSEYLFSFLDTSATSFLSSFWLFRKVSPNYILLHHSRIVHLATSMRAALKVPYFALFSVTGKPQTPPKSVCRSTSPHIMHFAHLKLFLFHSSFKRSILVSM